MNQPLPPDTNQSPSPEPGIRQQVENSILGGGIQSILGNNNNQIQQIINIFLASASDQLLRQSQEQGIDFTVSSFSQPPDLSIPRIVEQLSRRVETISTLKNICSSRTWIAIHGISGSGKRHLAVLLIEEIGKCPAWIKLRDLDIEKATQQLDTSLRAITTLAPQSNRYQWYCHICESLGNGTVLVLSMSCATGEEDSSLAVEFARQAVNLAEINDEIDDIFLVKALAELSIAQWLSSDMKAVFQSLDKALERLLACKSDTDDWKILFVAFGSVTGYFTSIACTGTPPRLTKSGEPYATPERGMFFKLNSQIVADYNSNFECYLLVNLANFAEALGSDDRVAFWSLKSIDEARIRKQYEVITTLSLKAIPHYLLQNSDLAKVLDIALDAGVGFAALIHELQSGQLTTVLELDVESILGNKPSELWRRAEHNAALIGLIPIVFRIATIALHNSELAKTQATEVTAICRQISATAVDSYLWVTAAELLEQIYFQEATHDGILRYIKTFDSQNYAVLKVIGYLLATLQNDTPLASAILDHLVIAPFVYSQPTKLTAAYRLVILPFFLEYWKDKFQSMPLSFSSPPIISQIFRQLETIPETERLQMILLTVAFNLNVSIPRNAAEWILESSPGLVAYFGM